MRLFDNAAIKIDLFPGRKDKRNGKNKNASKAETTTPSRTNAVQQAGRDGPKSTVRESKSLQNIARREQTEPRYQRPNTSRSYKSFSTGRSSTDHSAHSGGHESQHPGSNSSPQDDDHRTYQAPWSSTRHAEQDASSGTFHQRPSTGDSGKYHETSESQGRQAATRDTTSQSDDSERLSRDQRRSRADLQDEWVAEQKLRTNIPKGAPHSTSHALKHKRSKADMIRATENMARTLSRSPHRSPANRRQLGAVDETRPSTSSSNGSSRLPYAVQSNNSHSSSSANTSSMAPGQTSTRSQGPQHTSSLSNAESSSPRQTTAERSSSAKSTDRDPLSPTKVSGVAKKQGKAFNSTIRASPPLAMEPNKTTWSPTSSVFRKNNKTNPRQESDDAKSHSTQADRSGARARSTDSGSSERGNHDHDRNGNSKQRNSVDYKKSDHLSLAQREAYASSHNADAQIPPVINRSNGAWNAHSRDPSSSSARSRSRDNVVRSKTVAINNGSSTSTNNVQEEKGQSTHQNRQGQTGPTISSGISYMNYSRPTASDSEPNGPSAVANGHNEIPPQEAGVVSHIVDFANRAAKPFSSTQQQEKQTAQGKSAGSQEPKSKYVDASNSTTSPFQTRFNNGMSDPRTTAGLSRKGGKNKFSNSSVVEDAHASNNTWTTTAPQSKQRQGAPPSLPFVGNSQPRNADAQGNGRAKVVTVNNGGGSAVVATPMDSAFTHDRVDRRKDSGQSDSMDFGGKTTYSNRNEENSQVAVGGH